MGAISMMLGAGRTDAMSQVMMNANVRMDQMAKKMLAAGHELLAIGREMGKGELLDVTA
jgi:hypothetical protein